MMPWSSNTELPEQVRNALPAEAQSRWRGVANGALGRGASEESAIRQAWSVVGRGWKKPKDGGKWVRKVSKRTLFIRRPLANGDEFVSWAKSQGFETTLPPADLHTTIAYSKEPIEWPAVEQGKLVVKSSEDSRSVAPLGDEGAVVLKFESEALRDRWQDLLNQGASWDYAGFKPHVTISWDASGVDLSKVEPYSGPLIFGPEKMSEIDENWRSKVTEKFNSVSSLVAKVDDELGLVFGWAIVSKVEGEDFFDSQGDHIPEDSMLKAAADFMEHSRVAKEMHVGDQIGDIVFAFPLTDEVAKAMDLKAKYTGLMVAMKPANKEIYEKFKSGVYTGFSIGGQRVKDEDVEKAGFDPNQPRDPKGSSTGGQWTGSGGGSSDDSSENEFRRKFPDSERGAIEALRAMSDLKIGDDATAIPDPGVEGVWLVRYGPERNGVIVYLAGYKEPFGQERRMNDFEEVDG